MLFKKNQGNGLNWVKDDFFKGSSNSPCVGQTTLFNLSKKEPNKSSPKLHLKERKQTKYLIFFKKKLLLFCNKKNSYNNSY